MTSLPVLGVKPIRMKGGPSLKHIVVACDVFVSPAAADFSRAKSQLR